MWKTVNFTNEKFKPRILICDQDAHIGTILKDYLSSVGFHIFIAKNGFECIDIACLNHPDVILLDLDMPDYNGHLVMQNLRKMGIYVPVILFSHGGNEIPFDDDSAILKKPMRPKEIAFILETLLLETKKGKRFIPRRYKVH